MVSDTAGPAPAAREVTQFPCAKCGSRLVYAPATADLQCASCGSRVAIAAVDEPVEERDLEAALAGGLAAEPTLERITIACPSCGAQSTLAAADVADRCAFCGTTFVATAVSTRSLKPHWLLPFRIGLEEARTRFQAWARSLWFAPSRLAREASAGRVDGMYVPYWTFDAQTTSAYTGQRGDDHTETTESSDGKRTERTVTVWRPVRGTVEQDFDDVLVVASRSLSEKYADALQPWDLEALVPYRDEFVSGFRAETYQVGLSEGYEKGKAVMAAVIRRAIGRDIGGDHQRIESVETAYRRTTFKHVLLPIWISSYRFGDKVFRFLVNARTGEVQGERPYSWIKVACAVIAAAVVLFAIVWLMHQTR
jgi:DNA-directed RNA polymerase subunit RPC12/RpoP